MEARLLILDAERVMVAGLNTSVMVGIVVETLLETSDAALEMLLAATVAIDLALAMIPVGIAEEAELDTFSAMLVADWVALAQLRDAALATVDVAD